MASSTKFGFPLGKWPYKQVKLDVNFPWHLTVGVHRRFHERYNTSNALSNENHDNPLPDEESNLERIGVLSKLTNELDKKQICGSNLDIIVKNIFDKYYKQNKSDTASQIFLSLNKCRDHVNISPPKNLSSTKTKIDIDGLSKNQWIFQNIPIFDNAQEFSIHDLLCNLNQICEGLGFEVNRNEFEILLNQKLSAKTKTATRLYCSDKINKTK